MVQPYPEIQRETEPGRPLVEVHLPQELHVVMGAGGKPENEVYLERLAEEGIPLFKRKGGGGTVLLGPGTIVVTIHAHVADFFGNLGYFAALNRSLIAVFRGWADLPFAQRGISDIAVDGRKLVGTSLFRRRNYLLYQASILLELDLERMERYLRHPPREPDYRQGRSHREFVTSLRDLGVHLKNEQLLSDLKAQLPATAAQELLWRDEGR